MTYSELRCEVTALGFDDIIEREELLVSSINRALRTIFSERAVTRTVKLFSPGQRIVSRVREIRHTGGIDMTLPLAGRAYSMRVSGVGRVTVRDGNEERSFDFSSNSELIRGYLHTGGEVTFCGDYSYSVYDLITYSEAYSDNTEDIPDGSATRTFDIRMSYGDFLSFASLPRDNRGKCIQNCTLCDGKLEIDSEYCGEITLTYRRLPRTVTGAVADEVIDVPEEYAHLLALLVASYVWLDDDEDKAKYYKELYSEMLRSLGNSTYSSIAVGYTDTNGWA